MNQKISVLWKVLRVVPGLGIAECVLWARYRMSLLFLKFCYRTKFLTSRRRTSFSQQVLHSPLSSEAVPAAYWLRQDRSLEKWYLRFSSGEHQYFHWCWLPRRWRVHPLNGEVFDLLDWPLVKGPRDGDIKWVWDASRMDWIPQLMRYEALKRDGVAQAMFWATLEDWRQNNPATLGINWTCAQECSIRLINILWGAGFFASGSQSQNSNLNELVSSLAERIEFAADYGRSQRNNHGLTEATALLAASIALPRHPRAQVWRAFGQSSFIQQFDDQFAEDGSYILDSFSYHRQALRVSVVWLKLMRSAGGPVPSSVIKKLKAAAEFLANHTILGAGQSVADIVGGRVPNYGNTDGSNIFSFSGQTTFDYRPIAQLAYFAATERRLFPPGPYDEDIYWYFLNAVIPAEADLAISPRHAAKNGGYFSFSIGELGGLVRCHRIRRRPGHADMLHLDLWYKGLNVFCDSGTYSYAADEGSLLRSTLSHNTVSIDRADQMTPFRRFLWLDWTQAELLTFGESKSESVDCIRFGGRHSGYMRHPRKIMHSREVVAKPNKIEATDRLTCGADGKQFSASLRWNLTDEMTWVQEGDQITGKSEAGVMVLISVRIETAPSSTFLGKRKIAIYDAARSRIYGKLSKGPALVVDIESDGDVTFNTDIHFVDTSSHGHLSK
jgi:hypothetical protein